MIEKDLYYTQEHEWVRVAGNLATVGITDHAQELLGEVTYVEFPDVDTEVTQGDQFSVVESSKAASDVYAPVTGTVVEINESLDNSPEQINDSCYQDGWICKIQISDPACLDNLMDATAYEKYLEEAED